MDYSVERETHLWLQETELYPLAQYTPDQFYYYTSQVMGGPAVYQTVDELVNYTIKCNTLEKEAVHTDLW